MLIVEYLKWQYYSSACGNDGLNMKVYVYMYDDNTMYMSDDNTMYVVGDTFGDQGPPSSTLPHPVSNVAVEVE